MKASEFPISVCAFAADTTGTHCYSNLLYDRKEVDKRVAHYSENDKVTRIRIATYQLVKIETVFGEDPEPSARDKFYAEQQVCGHNLAVYFGKGDWIHVGFGTICIEGPEAPPPDA